MSLPPRLNSQRKRLTFRVQQIPLNFNEDDLKSALQRNFDGEESVHIQISVTLVPSCGPQRNTRDALVEFEPHAPAFLQNKAEEKTARVERQIRIDGGFLSIDSQFLGLTQVSGPSDEKGINMDVVFITGLDGNAYGSWTSRKTGLMWPREFLKHDLPNARVMIYGYNTKLSDNTSHTLEDFCNHFLTSVKLARQCKEASRRDLVLIGHSYGARVITEFVVKCKILDKESFAQDLLMSIRSIVFFGAPHCGLDTTDIETYLNETFSGDITGDARKSLVAELKENNPTIQRKLQDFKDLVGRDLAIQIISIYERKPARRLVQISKSPKGISDNQSDLATTRVREGEAYNPLSKSSAVLGFPSWLEMRIPSESDHSNMAKFDQKDDIYWALMHALQTIPRERQSDSWSASSKPLQFANELILVSLDSLYFPTAPEIESNRDDPDWLQYIRNFLAGTESSGLKLKPKRFGALKSDAAFQRVMVEFRPYPRNDDIEKHYQRRLGFEETARMILNSRNEAFNFPSVPLHGISVTYATSTPCFLFIYEAEDLFALDECFQKFAMPLTKDRIWIALQFAKAVATLHAARVCHGLINIFNLYLKAPNSSIIPEKDSSVRIDVHKSSPMLAGFEILRNVENHSDLIDVETPTWRVFLHPDRLSPGTEKARQIPEHDVFSLGMVMIAIGLWTPFTSFNKYQNANTEQEAQQFAKKLRKQFPRGGMSNGVPSEYGDIVSYALGRSESVPGQRPVAGERLSLDVYREPNASCVAEALSRLLEKQTT